ncbi:MAG: transposase [Sphingomonas echinoides]|jgi:transposase
MTLSTRWSSTRGLPWLLGKRRPQARHLLVRQRRYRRRSRIEIMFGRLKDWRRVATRYGRCPTVFFSVVFLATTIIVWL